MTGGNTIFLIVVALGVGYAGGRFLAPATRARISRWIAPLVWILLFTIGIAFGGALGSASKAWYSVRTGLLFAFSTTGMSWWLIYLSHRRVRIFGDTIATPNAAPVPSPAFAARAALRPLKECTVALLMVAAGVFVSVIALRAGLTRVHFLPTTGLLYLLIVLVGVELVDVPLSRGFLSKRLLAIPCLVVAGSLTGGVIAAVISGETMMHAAALSSGFGWFTLSAVMVGQHLGDHFGTVALLTDLFRELFSILLLYGLGRRFPLACVGAAGATALDSTLLMVKQTCPADVIPLALASGFILSLLAPVLISFFLTH